MHDFEKDKIEKQLEALSRHQDQQKAMFDSLEGIRWKFITSFGFGAGFALFFSSKSFIYEENQRILFLSLVVVIIVSLASLVTQIRTYSLICATWHQIGLLQAEEAKLLHKLYDLEESLMNVLVFPGSTTIKSPIQHLLTVHMATCLIFCCFIGISLNIILSFNVINLYFLDFLIITGILLSLVWYVTVRYTKYLMKSSDFDSL